MSLLRKFNCVLFVLFLLGLLVAGWVTYKMQQSLASKEVLKYADVMMTTAEATRSYTSEEVAPIVQGGDFVPQAIPAYSARNVFNRLHEIDGEYRDYRYKEAMLNPTNPRDLASGWELDLIESFRVEHEGGGNVDEMEQVGVSERSVFLAKPILLKPDEHGGSSCLQCHGHYEDAPASMVSLYREKYAGWPYLHGDDPAGFHWEVDEVIGARIVSLPVELVEKKAWSSVLVLWATLLSFFLLCYLVVNTVVARLVVAPLARLADEADRCSRGESGAMKRERTGRDEIGALARAIQRLDRSLDKAVRRRKEGGRDDGKGKLGD